MAAESLLLEVGILLAGLAVAGALASRLGQSVIPFYIVVGLLLGEPGLEVGGLALDWVSETEFVVGAAELGIVLLLFFLGLEFSFGKLVGGRDRILKAGSLDLAINLPLGLVLGFAFGFGLVESLFLAGIVYISSSAIITKSLIDLEWIANSESEAILGVLVYEDLFIAFFLSLVSALALGGATAAGTVGRMAAAVAVMAALTLLAAYGSEQLARLVNVPSDEVAMLQALAVAVLGSGAALQFGLSEAVAAFFVGMAFGETDQVDELERLMNPLKDLFGAVFFFWVGLRMDPALLLSTPGLLAAAIVLTGGAKVLSGVLAGRVYGLSSKRQLRVGLAMVPRAEFSLIIATLASLSGLGPTMTETIPAFTVAYVLILSIVGTIGMQSSEHLEAWIVSAYPPPHEGGPGRLEP